MRLLLRAYLCLLVVSRRSNDVRSMDCVSGRRSDEEWNQCTLSANSLLSSGFASHLLELRLFQLKRDFHEETQRLRS